MEMEEGDKNLAADRILGRARLSEGETKMATLLANALFANNSVILCRPKVRLCTIISLAYDWPVGSSNGLVVTRVLPSNKQNDNLSTFH